MFGQNNCEVKNCIGSKIFVKKMWGQKNVFWGEKKKIEMTNSLGKKHWLIYLWVKKNLGQKNFWTEKQF